MEKDRILNNFRFLIKNVEPIPILDILIQYGHSTAEQIRSTYKSSGPDEANRMIIDSLSRMKDGKGYQHYIEALQEDHADFVLEKLGFPTVTNVTACMSNATRPPHHIAPTTHSNTASNAAVENSENPEESSFPRNNNINSITLGLSHMEVSDGAASSRSKADQPDCIATSSQSATSSETIQEENVYENINRRASESEHVYAHVTEGEGMIVYLVKPAILHCSRTKPSPYPEELSALTKDRAWHANITDGTIHKVVGNLNTCPAGTYIMWYSKAKAAMMVSVAVPEIAKKHVHFKMLRTEEDGVLHFHFDSRFHSTNPEAVLQYAKTNGLEIKPAKLRYYQRQS